MAVGQQRYCICEAGHRTVGHRSSGYQGGEHSRVGPALQSPQYHGAMLEIRTELRERESVEVWPGVRRGRAGVALCAAAEREC